MKNDSLWNCPPEAELESSPSRRQESDPQRRGDGGRTLRATWPLPGAVGPLGRAERLREWEPRVVQWVGTDRLDRRFEAARGWQGPLGLVERLRWGLESEGPVARFEVLSGLPELLRVERTELRFPLGGLPLRSFRLLDGGGATRGSALFVGHELAALSWQGGGPLAVRTSRERYDALAGSHPLVSEGDSESEAEAGSDPDAHLRG